MENVRRWNGPMILNMCKNGFKIIISIPAAVDKDGISVDHLEELIDMYGTQLSTSDHTAMQTPFSAMVYLVTLFANPSGVSLSPGKPDAPKTESCNDTNSVVFGDIGNCRYENLRCHQWRRIWHHEDSRFSLS